MTEQIKIDFEKAIKDSDLSENDINLKKKFLNNFITKGFPSKKIENWKFLDINQIIKKDIGELSFFNEYSPLDKVDESFFVKDLEHNKIVFINGKVERINFDYEDQDKIEINESSKLEDKFKNSWLHKELYEARNVKPSFSWGLILGIIFTGIDQILFRGKLPFTLKHKHADHETLKPANQMPKIDYPKYDNVITFDKTSSVYLTGTNHADNQPVHLKLKDPDLPINYTLEKFDEPAQRYCPAGVYEVQKENDQNKFVINSQNCIHCKTCDIKEPSQNITWVTPEGSGGPKYGNM